MATNLFDDWPRDYAVQFWKQYPRKVDKIAALKALEKVHDRGDVPWVKLMGAVAKYSASFPPAECKFIKHPQTWLNAGCWDNEEPAARRVSSFYDEAKGAINGR